MRRVRRENTAPEMVVRRYLHSIGLRYKLHDPGLPGSPDLVFPKRRTVVFVHGCFWHGHDCGHGRVKPKTNAEFWATKLLANRERDDRKRGALLAAGWRVEIVWECEVRSRAILSRLARRLLCR